jgi:hypothetical protein
VFTLGGLLASTTAHAGGWDQVVEKDGIVVHEMKVAGRTMPVFRGRTAIDASPTEILAVLQDTRRHIEWRPNCAQTHVVEEVGPTERFVYSRSDAPWPAADRDVVLRSSFTIVVPGKHIESKFEAARHPSAPVVDGVVRITHLRGHYKLVALDNGSTSVEYQVDADPGGSVPTWMAVRESRQVPFDTLRNLRAQVHKTRGHYRAFVSRWDGGS